MSLLLIKTLMLKQAAHHGKSRNKPTKTSPLLPKRDTTDSCFICEIDNGSIPIFGSDKYPNIPAHIAAIAGVSIPVTSKRICKRCHTLLEQCIVFRNKCRKRLSISNILEKQENVCDTAPLKVKDEKVGENNAEIDTIESDALDETLYPTLEIPPSDSPTTSIFDYSYKTEKIPKPKLTTAKVKRKRSCDENSLRTSSPELEPWSCPNCKKKFKTTREYQLHCFIKCSKNMSEGKPRKNRFIRELLCEICGKNGRYQTILRHIKSHSDEFPYQCDNCPFRTKQREYILMHMRTHSEAKKFLCTQCPYSSKYNSNLHNHIRRKHEQKYVKCGICGQDYLGKANLQKHIDRTHLHKDARVCHICQNSYNSQKSLRKHLIRHHKITNKTELSRGCQFHKGSYKNFLAQQHVTNYNSEEVIDPAFEMNMEN